MSYKIFDFIGNIGVALIVVSFLLLQTGKIESRSVGYLASIDYENFLAAHIYGLYRWLSAKKEILSADKKHSSQ